MAFEKPQLDQYRNAINGNQGQQLVELLKPQWRLDPPELKRVPAPFDAAHTRGDLLRRKGLVVWQDKLDEGLRSHPMQTLKQVFSEFSQLQDWLAQVVT